ncbi:protein of unknown function [Pseudomonas sp. JV551A1]|nr:protein of unknown function [Pseudomonas sp. JV551A1]
MAIVGQDHQAGGVEVQPPGNVQALTQRGWQQVEHGAVLRVLSGADAACGLVQHQVARRAACLQQLVVQLHAAEFAHFGQWVADNLAIHPHTALREHEPDLLTVVAGQVGEETVEAHDRRSVGSGGAKLLFDGGAARAQAGFIAQFGGQGLEHGRVDGHAVTPAFLRSPTRVGQAALVEGAASRAVLVVGHGCRSPVSNYCGNGTAPWRHCLIQCR